MTSNRESHWHRRVGKYQLCFCVRLSTFGGPATGVAYANWTGARAPCGWSFDCPKGPCSDGCDRRVPDRIGRSFRAPLPTEFPCRLWNAMGRAKSMKTGVLRLAIKNPPTDRDDYRLRIKKGCRLPVSTLPRQQTKMQLFDFWGLTGFLTSGNRLAEYGILRGSRIHLFKSEPSSGDAGD